MKKLILNVTAVSVFLVPINTAAFFWNDYNNREKAERILAEREAREREARINAIKAELDRKEIEALKTFLCIATALACGVGYTCYQTIKFPIELILCPSEVKSKIKKCDTGTLVGLTGTAALTGALLALILNKVSKA